MEELYFTAFQTVLCNRHDEARYVVLTYDSDGYWCTRVYQCDSNGDYDWTDCVDKDVIYFGGESVHEIDKIINSHMEYIKKYSPLTGPMQMIFPC